MDNNSFSDMLNPWMATGSKQLVTYIPSGSGVYRLVDVPPEQYQTGFTSTAVGSFKNLCESGNWGGSDINTCFAEAGPTGIPIYEVTQFTQDTPVLTAFNLPEVAQRAIYEDRFLPSPEKFDKSLIVLALASTFLPVGSYSGVFFPSRRNPVGGVLVYNPNTLPFANIIYTGQNPPPAGLFD
jgi:hypothetical protein